MAEISYTKTNWVNNVTKLNADNMNHIENGIEALDVALNTKASVDYVNKTHYGYSGDDLLIIPEGTTTIGDFTYSGTTYKCVVIPDSVTSIGAYAFAGCGSLTSITIPNSVTSIGSVAFSGCIGLTNITIPSNITDIGMAVFESCTGLTSITIPSSVTNISEGAFYQVPLKIIDLTAYVTESFPTLDTNNFAYIASDCQIKVIKGRKSELSAMTNWSAYADHIVEVETADTAVTTAENYTNKTHYGYSGSDLLIIPDGTTTIGNHAYENTNYKCVVIPNSVTSIGDYAFENCSGLTSITIPSSVTSIGDWVFSGCSSLISITIPEGVTSIGNHAFYNCTGLTSITIGNGVTSIDNNAFEGCAGLKNITIPDSVTSIGNEAFSGCSGLVSITIPESVTSIGWSAFSGCSGLMSITIPEGVTNIEFSMFEDCSGLMSITIPEGVTSIGSFAFYNVPLNIIDLAAYVTEPFPTLDTNNFNSIAANCQIKVVKGRKAALAAMTNWSAYADHIVEVPTVETLQKEIDELKAQLLALTNV